MPMFGSEKLYDDGTDEYVASCIRPAAPDPPLIFSTAPAAPAPSLPDANEDPALATERRVVMDCALGAKKVSVLDTNEDPVIKPAFISIRSSSGLNAEAVFPCNLARYFSLSLSSKSVPDDRILSHSERSTRPFPTAETPVPRPGIIILQTVPF